MIRARGFTHDDANNKSVEWYTPPWIFEALGLQFDLDPAAPPGGVPWIPATRHFTEEDNGLVQKWNGLVWCNPPYGRDTGKWLERMHQHRKGIALVFARTDCRWFHDYVAKADALLFLKGRVSFVDGFKVTGGNGAGAGSMLVAWGADGVAALKGMRSMGLFVALTIEDLIG